MCRIEEMNTINDANIFCNVTLSIFFKTRYSQISCQLTHVFNPVIILCYLCILAICCITQTTQIFLSAFHFLNVNNTKKGSKTCTSYHDLQEALTKRNSSKTRFFKVKRPFFLSSENFDLAYLKNTRIYKQCESIKYRIIH